MPPTARHIEFLSHLLALMTDRLALAGMVMVAGFVVTRLSFQTRPTAKFLCKLTSFASFSVMLAIAHVSPLRPTAVTGLSLTYLTVSIFKIVWWLAASWLFAGLLHALPFFRRRPMDTRFLQDICAGVIYLCAILGIIAYVLDIPVSGLLAASGVIAIVLGLALQTTLGDLFSGIALNFAKPYRPGDWVILDGGTAGCVIETNWRATQILTYANDLATIPNSIIAKSRIVNASQPVRAHGITVIVRLDPAVAPSLAIQMVATALLGCNLILRLPKAIITVGSLDAVALECEVQVFVASIDQASEARNEVFDLLFRNCASAGIRLASPAGGAILPPGGPPQDPGDIPRRILERLPIFTTLSGDERDLLAPKMLRRTYKAGDTVVEQGVVAPSLAILTSGVLVAVKEHGGHEIEVLRFAPGACFDLTSVLTGAVTTCKVVALTPAAVYEIPLADLAPILKARPSLAADLGQIMARLNAAGIARLSEIDGADKHADHLATRLADRVKLLFGL